MTSGKLKSGFRIPAIILAIFAMVMLLLYHVIDIIEFSFSSSLISSFEDAIVLDCAAVMLVYLFGVCNTKAGKIMLGINMGVFALLFMYWVAMALVDNYFNLYYVCYILNFTSYGIFAVWLFTRSKSKIMPLISLGISSLTFLHHVSLTSMNLIDFMEYGDLYYTSPTWIPYQLFLRLFELTIILVILSEMFRTYAPAYQDQFYTNTAYTNTAYTNTAYQPVPQQIPTGYAPQAQQYQPEDTLELLNRLFERGEITEKEYSVRLTRLIAKEREERK